MPHRINLALQGGGSHGAFTWGVLDALLERHDLAFEGISGTSAGAVNAVALASGWATALRDGGDPREGARACLRGFWEEVAGLCSIGSLHRQLFSTLWGGTGSGIWPWLPQSTGFSPYVFNPLDVNPLRDLLARRIDFAAVRDAHQHQRDHLPHVYITATHVATGRARIFRGAEVTAESVMASACLPQLFQATVIDGESYWDGGFAANPALTPLLSECRSRDLLLVQINAMERAEVPHASADILARVNEIAFNASLLTQVRLVATYNRLVAARDSLPAAMRLHRVHDGALLSGLPMASRTVADPALVRQLFEGGRAAAIDWLARHFDDLGTRSTIDAESDYRDDTWLALDRDARGPVRRLLAGLARLGRRPVGPLRRPR